MLVLCDMAQEQVQSIKNHQILCKFFVIKNPVLCASRYEALTMGNLLHFLWLIVLLPNSSKNFRGIMKPQVAAGELTKQLEK
jgi:hypothetical protein